MKYILTLVLIAQVALLNAQSINGTLTDENKEPLVGALVKILDTYIGDYTDAEGKFSLPITTQRECTIQISMVGFEPLEEKVTYDGNSLELNPQMKPTSITLDEFTVAATRASNNAPVAYTELDKDAINANNQGQDLPILLNWSPSIITDSDAGAGVGYTGLRLRGVDATQINVTVNGIPINDAESQAVFWVNMPDLASSTNSIQIQRGVGTSTNGAGAFGGTINLQTDLLNPKMHAEVNNSFGSFNTMKNSILFGSGLINNHWAFEGRLSNIQSDGYIDRATSDLKSYFFSAGYYGEKTTAKVITFAGREVTYQAWWGTPESRITGNQNDMLTHAANNRYTQAQTDNLLSAGRTFNYYLYDNEVDDYGQDHYQLHLTHRLSNNFEINGALHYTKGAGFFEQFKEDEDLADYGLNPLQVLQGTDTITTTNLVRRRWLDNDFYGATLNLTAKFDKLNVIFGQAYNRYEGDHFGEIISADFIGNNELGEHFYNNKGIKNDNNVFTKMNYQASNKTNVYADLQLRHITYGVQGNDIDQRNLATNAEFTFFNPKFGITHQINSNSQVFASYSVGNKEPTRNDIIDAPANQRPKYETLYDWELGYRRNHEKYFFEANFYYMDYENQLVLTGELNDVGSTVRTNVDESYRTGLEFQLGWNLHKKWSWMVNATFSQNKIKNFTEIVYDYTNGFDIVENQFTKTDISFSPSTITASQLTYTHNKNLSATWLLKQVGKQYLDNTLNDDRSIDGYVRNDLRLDYNFKWKAIKAAKLTFQANNVLDKLYSAKGYTYGYIFGDLITENFYYPQATRNFMVGLNLSF